jgi:hypothetical protein
VFPNGFKIGDWINNKATGHVAPLTWIYKVAEVLPNLVKAIEFRMISLNNLIRAMSTQEVTLSSAGYHSVKVLSQEKHEAPFKVVRDVFALPKSILFWIFETSFINSLPWVPRKWHGKCPPPWGTRPSLVTRLNRDI